MRDVIRVERRLDAPEAADGPPSGGRSHDRDVASVSVDRASLDALRQVADEVLPPLVARLAVSHLGELEVRHGGWRIRVRRAAQTVGAQPGGSNLPSGTRGVDHPVGADGAGTPHGPQSSREHDPHVATSPAVGYFAPRPEVAVGTSFAQGDLIGWIDVLGVRQEVVAPVDGLVGRLMVGPGDPVEYGQELVQLVPAGMHGGTRSGQVEDVA